MRTFLVMPVTSLEETVVKVIKDVNSSDDYASSAICFLCFS